MAFASSSVFKDHERWLRIATLLDFGGRELCLTVLHKYEGLPTDGAMLYRELEPAKHKIARFKHQMEILCPPTGITDVNKFDLTLLTSIIAQKFPGKYDQVVSDIRNARNREYHRGNKRLDDIEFINLWNDTAHMLERHGFDLQLIGDLKTCDLSIDNKFKDVAMHIFVEDCTGRLYDEVKDLQADTKETKDLVKQIFHATIRESEKNKDAENGQISKAQFIIDNDDTQRGAEEPNLLLDLELKDIRLTKCEKIGQGAFATVYRCENKDFGVDIAMKEVDCLENKEKVDALHREIQILSNLKHKHIVRYYGSRQDKNSISIFMEFAKEGTIRKLISAKGALCEKDVSKYCQQILEGLAYLHENKTMHRDLKCANILLDKDGNCKLTDFGISKHAENVRSTAGAVTDCGTCYWMSPECILGEEYGWKSDIWSFGCTVFEMLNTEPPYRELNASAAMFKIVNGDMKLQFPPDSSNHCMSFTKLCFRKNPQERPSAKDLLDHRFVSLWNDS